MFRLKPNNDCRREKCWVSEDLNPTYRWNSKKTSPPVLLLEHEVLDYEATLELKDKRGKRADVRKYEKVNLTNSTINNKAVLEIVKEYIII